MSQLSTLPPAAADPVCPPQRPAARARRTDDELHPFDETLAAVMSSPATTAGQPLPGQISAGDQSGAVAVAGAEARSPGPVGGAVNAVPDPAHALAPVEPASSDMPAATLAESPAVGAPVPTATGPGTAPAPATASASASASAQDVLPAATAPATNLTGPALAAPVGGPGDGMPAAGTGSDLVSATPDGVPAAVLAESSPVSLGDRPAAAVTGDRAHDGVEQLGRTVDATDAAGSAGAATSTPGEEVLDLTGTSEPSADAQDAVERPDEPSAAQRDLPVGAAAPPIAERRAAGTATPTAGAPAPQAGASASSEPGSPAPLRAPSTHRLTVDLGSEGLGPLRVEALSDHGTLHLNLTAGDHATRDALGARLPELRHDLESAGLQLGTLDVGDGGDRRAGDQAARGPMISDGRDRAERATGPKSPGGSARPASPPSPTRSNPSGFDLRL